MVVSSANPISRSGVVGIVSHRAVLPYAALLGVCAWIEGARRTGFRGVRALCGVAFRSCSWLFATVWLRGGCIRIGGGIANGDVDGRLPSGGVGDD